MQGIDISEARRFCREWAQCHREITRVYLFGSRVYGSPRRDSDLDVFIVTDGGAFVLNRTTWERELSTRLGVRCEVHDYFSSPDCVKSAAMGRGLLVFSRHGDNRDLDFGEDAPDVVDD